MSSTQFRLQACTATALAPWASPHNKTRRSVCGAWRALALALLLASAGSTALHAQQNRAAAQMGEVVNRPNSLSTLGTNQPTIDPNAAEERRLLQLNNAAHHSSMVSAAGKLLSLANELHAEVAAGNIGSLTPEQLRMVRQIEKLARKVKGEMAACVTDRQGG